MTPAGPRAPQIGLVTVRPRAGLTEAAALGRLRALPGVTAAYAEHHYTLRDVPDDPALTTPETATGTPGGYVQEWWAAREHFPEAWSHTHGANATVGVIDTGVDGTHPELRSKLKATFDLDDQTSTPATVDEVGHGTHVAALACADTDNGVGLAGAGWGCRLVLVKSDLSDASISAGLVDAADRGAQAVNMSFGDAPGSQASPAVVRAIDYAVKHGVVLVAAAADDPVTEQGDPANTLQPAGTAADMGKGIGLTVTAADIHDTRADFAGLGDEISLAAYGDFDRDGSCPVTLHPTAACGPPGILSAFPENGSLANDPLSPCGCQATLAGDDRYAYFEGTSMAAPQVTATAALVRALNPDLSVTTVVRLLKRTARRRGGWSPQVGWGILDAGAAVDAAAAMDERSPRTQAHGPKGGGRVGRRLTVHWSGRDRSPAGVHRAGLVRVALYGGRVGQRARRLARVPVRKDHALHFTPTEPGRYVLYSLGVDARDNHQTKAFAPIRVRVRAR